RERSRVVLETDGFLAISPWASRGPFELLVLPREHRSVFEQTTPHELRGLADALRASLRKLDLALDKPACNFYLHTLPLRGPASVHPPAEPLVRPQGAVRRVRQGLSRQPQAIRAALRGVLGSGQADQLPARLRARARLAGGPDAAHPEAGLGGAAGAVQVAQ